jgi:hypothetical protein
MNLINRGALVIWMYIAAIAGLFAVGIPILAAYAIAWLWSGQESRLGTPAVTAWLMRLGLAVGVWIGARRAKRQAFGRFSPTAVTCGGISGLVGGFVVGGVVADVWGADILTPLNLEPASYSGDIQAGIMMGSYGLGVLLGSFVRAAEEGA